MTRDRSLAFGIYGLGAWSLFVWSTRIRNALDDDTLDTAAKDVTIALSLLLIGLTLWACVARFRLRSSNDSGPGTFHSVGGAEPSPHRASADTLALVAALASIAIWVFRVPTIWVADHEVPFKVVHTMLAVVTWALGGLVIARVRKGRIVEPDIPAAPVAGVSPAGVPRR